jgi:hypothetical protein
MDYPMIFQNTNPSHGGVKVFPSEKPTFRTHSTAHTVVTLLPPDLYTVNVGDGWVAGGCWDDYY